jgi:23S rRNA (guanosine2251-2'-O)-methyltransferase
MKNLVWGRQAVLETLRSSKTANRLILRHGVRGEGILKIRLEASQQSVPIEELPPKVFDKLMGKKPAQGVALELGETLENQTTWEDILQIASAEGKIPLLLILDGVEDPQNFGAILRSAEAAGVHGVLVRDRRAAPISGTVMKASAGAAAHIPVAKVTGLPNVIAKLQEQGIWIVAAVEDGEEILFDADLTGPIAVIVGSEGAGISHLILKNCDRTVRIPMQGSIGSLNVSASTAIILFEILRQRSTQS